MKIAIARSWTEGPPTEADGWAVDLASALAARGKDVTLLCRGRPGSAGPDPAGSSADGGTAELPVLAGPAGPIGGGSPAWHIRRASSLLVALRSGRFDLVHLADPRAAIAVERARRFGLVKARAILAHRPGAEPAGSIDRFDYVHHLAPDPPEGVPWRSTWTAIPRFVDVDAFAPGRGDALRLDLEIPPEAVVALVLAPIRRNRDRSSRLIDECAQLLARDPEAPLDLIRAGPSDPETPEMIARARAALRDRVRVLPDLPLGCLPDLYRAADLFVLGTLGEPMSIALARATAAGLPCVVHHHPSLGAVGGPGGVPVDLEVPGALASTLAALVADPERRDQIGRAAREHCLRSFARDLVLYQILDYYREVLLDGCLRRRADRKAITANIA